MNASVARFSQHISYDESGCWLWTARRDRDGYGRFSIAGTSDNLVHRVSYRLFIGEIPAGLEVDHLCHNLDPTCEGGVTCHHRACVNPGHLEAVTRRTNSLRGKSFVAFNAAKTHCPQGHPYNETNSYIYTTKTHSRRCCRVCNRAAAARYAQRLRSASA